MQAGFECSTHILSNGRRLDLVAATQHDVFAARDYRRLREIGIQTVREGLRWHLVEPERGKYDFTSALTHIEAARERGIQIVWDLMHFGWPEWLDIFAPEWPERLGQLALAFAKVLLVDTQNTPFIVPVNEISFTSWAGGDVGYLNPFCLGRGTELKRQLIRGFINAANALRMQIPKVRLIAPDPVIHMVGDSSCSEDRYRAAAGTFSMFEAWDMLAGRREPELGGGPAYLDVIGINFYPHNQRRTTGEIIPRWHCDYRPFREILREVAKRYGRPMVVSETGAEGVDRAGWFAYIADEVTAAASAGADLRGVCLYPILNHPGWDDGRHCHNGLWDYASPEGEREAYAPLAIELSHQKQRIEESMKTASYLSSVDLGSPHPDLICLSHLRWNFVFQRPQHLMSRFARNRRVFFIEEPVLDSTGPRLVESICSRTGVVVAVPHLPCLEDPNRALEALLLDFSERHAIRNPVLWFYTPMALEFIPPSMQSSAVVYDCMDELSLFRGAPPRLQQLEKALTAKTDVLFTGGMSLFEAKRHLHVNTHAAPSGVDRHHFAQARSLPADFAEQATMPYPRLGYAGVIDERIDLDLIDTVSRRRPEWQFVMIGPIAKISPESLPQRSNIHWLGIKDYSDLPRYFAGWDVGIMPFALNEATRFISPTKTPEYLAAGLPVVSTAIRDVVGPYGETGMAAIAHSVDEFIAEAAKAMLLRQDAIHRHTVDSFLQGMSWDSVWERMDALISEALAARRKSPSLAPACESLLEAVELQSSVSVA